MREDLLSYRPKIESSILFFMSTYRQDIPKVRDIVNKRWPINESFSTLNEIFTERPTMTYRRPKSLRDNEPLGETPPCGKARCKTCKMITLTQIAKSASRATIKLRATLVVSRPNFVYLITCTKCGKQYIGETGDHVNQRMNCHRDDWKHKRFERSPVASVQQNMISSTTPRFVS